LTLTDKYTAGSSNVALRLIFQWSDPLANWNISPPPPVPNGAPKPCYPIFTIHTASNGSIPIFNGPLLRQGPNITANQVMITPRIILTSSRVEFDILFQASGSLWYIISITF
jgi:hypothetical protein